MSMRIVGPGPGGALPVHTTRPTISDQKIEIAPATTAPPTTMTPTIDVW